jgi:aminoglycoside 3-N-acetyltransferase
VKETAAIDRSMGAIPVALRDLPGTVRSDHPWHSWLAHGPDAERLIEPHPWTLANPEIERLAALGGDVVFMGVGLKSCTAAHVAEERAGRRPFIRWNVGRDGVVRRIRVSGCSKGFDRLWPASADLFREDRIGGAVVRVAPLPALIDRLAATMIRDPQITVCSPTCPFCRDMVLGGPADDA